jgi:outer membrane receptor protein involved in Fe transport
MIERIEVLKDGASAVYGSDAIGGVVNIITKKRMNGTELSAYSGVSSQGDGKSYDLNLTSGAASDKGGVLFNLGYFDQAVVTGADRKWSEFGWTYNYATGGWTKGGSGTIPAGLANFTKPILDAECAKPNASLTASMVSICTQYRTGGTGVGKTQWMPVLGSANTWKPYASATDSYNTNPPMLIQQPQRRVSFFANGDYNIGTVGRGYFEASYVNRRGNYQMAPEPLMSQYFGENGASLSQYSQYNPFGVEVPSVQRRLLEFGPRTFSQDVDTIHSVAGVDGFLGDIFGPLRGWNWDVNTTYGRSLAISTTSGTLRAPYVAAALGPSQGGVCYGSVDTTGPTPVYSNPIAGCTPIDLLNVAGPITDAMKGSLGFQGTDRGSTTTTTAAATVGGELFKLFADRPAAIALGYEYREYKGYQIPDPISASGENSGNNSSPVGGGYNVTEGFAELSLPLLSNVDFAQDLELSLAARTFKYSTFGSDTTYKLGGRWSPIRDVTLRGTYSTAFRAPSIGELYSGQSDSFEYASDPCAGDVDADGNVVPWAVGSPNYTLAQFNALTAQCGAAFNNNNPASQIRTRQGGNPDLKPETAKIFTVGVVLEPRMVPNLSVTVDYYRVDLTKTVNTIGTGVILAGCYPGSAGAGGQYCDKIARDPASGWISRVADTLTNVGSTVTSGVDVGARYDLPTDAFGRFALSGDANFLLNYDVTKPDGTVVKGKGNYDLGVFPSVKFNAGVLWGLEGFGAGVNARFVGSYKECANASGRSGQDGLCYADSTYSHTVANYTSFDLFAKYDLKSSVGTTTLSGGVRNVMDQNPAKVYDGYYGSTEPTAYDTLGRYFYVRLAQLF